MWSRLAILFYEKVRVIIYLGVVKRGEEGPIDSPEIGSNDLLQLFQMLLQEILLSNRP